MVGYRLLDLQTTCEYNENNELINCQCFDAQRRIDKGQINCGIENQCPEDCGVCKFCLYHVLECHPGYVPKTNQINLPFSSPSNSPSVVPSTLPSILHSDTPTEVPSESPSHKPSRVPSVQPTYIPSSTPTFVLSNIPSNIPSTNPTVFFSKEPSKVPSLPPFDLNDKDSYSIIW